MKKKGNTLKRIRSVICLVVMTLIAWAWASNTHAASSGDVTVTVTIQNVSVGLSGATWAIGTIATGETREMTGTTEIIVTNDGNVAETFSLKLTNPPLPSPWTADETAPIVAGSEIYAMKGLFVGGADNPTGTNFGDDDAITTTVQNASATKFGFSAATANGANVGAGSSVDLRLQFTAPTSTTESTAQSIVITVGATVP